MSGNSSHGGAREGSGRKPKFESDDETKTIRVPASHKDEMERVIDIVDTLIAQGFKPEEIEKLLKETFKK